MLKKAKFYIKEGIYTVRSICSGHVVTFKNLFRKKVTMQYPEVRWELPQGYRGLPSLPVDPDTGKDICIGCGACARVCPTQLITIETHMGEDKKRVIDEFKMNIALCMFCGFCADICPVDAIQMSDHYELCEFTREELLYDRERLNKMGGVREPKQTPEPAEAKEEA
ncbi:MAG: NuoI/complex I 23 kDa subunit family protein [Armatimonadota bacterium]